MILITTYQSAKKRTRSLLTLPPPLLLPLLQPPRLPLSRPRSLETELLLLLLRLGLLEALAIASLQPIALPA